jgi:hypothetical protein
VSLLDVDLDAPRRVEGIAADGLRALGEVRERSAAVDKAVDEMFERQERTRQELDEQVRQAAEGEQPEEKADEDRPKPKRTLALGGDEFHQARETTQAEAPKPPAPPPAGPEPEPKNEAPAKTLKLGAREDTEDTPAAPQPNRTMKFGARDDEEPQPEQRPPRRPRPRPEGDDDLSGRTWLR